MKEYKLNVYADCQSEEPSKVYTCRRILFKTANELGGLQEQSKKADNNSQREIMLKMLKAVFPNFVDEDLDGIDPIELGTFFKSLGSEINQVVSQAEKNL